MKRHANLEDCASVHRIVHRVVRRQPITALDHLKASTLIGLGVNLKPPLVACPMQETSVKGQLVFGGSLRPLAAVLPTNRSSPPNKTVSYNACITTIIR